MVDTLFPSFPRNKYRGALFSPIPEFVLGEVGSD